MLSAIATFSITASPVSVMFCERNSSAITASRPDTFTKLKLATGAIKSRPNTKSANTLTVPVPAGTICKLELAEVPCKTFPVNDTLSIATNPCAVNVGAVVASNVALLLVILFATDTLPVTPAVLENVFVAPVV